MNNLDFLFFKDNNSTWTELDGGLKRKIIGFDDQLMMVKIFFPKGAIGYEHNHHHSQSTYISKGVFEVTIDRKKEVLKEGDSFFVPSNVKHGVVNIEEGILIDVLSPKRDDFL